MTALRRERAAAQLLGAGGGTALRRERAAAQLLGGGGATGAPGAATLDGAVGHLLAVQAQDLRAARLALRARVPGATAGGVDALLGDGTLVVGWLLRGTLHLVAREDYGWLLGLTAPGRLAGNRRRLGQEGVTPEQADRAVEVIGGALAGDGPLTRPQLRERLDAAGLPTAGQALPHLLALAAWRGVAVLGPVADRGHAFASAATWLGAAPPTALEGEARAAALAELARRYLVGHGPATPADLASWSGLALRDARAGLAALGAGVATEASGLARLARPEDPADSRGALPPRLLPAFDPYLLGWKDRGHAVAPEHARAVHPGGGIVRATAIVDGRVVGTWRRGRRDGDIELDALQALGNADAAALRDEAADVRRFEAG